MIMTDDALILRQYPHLVYSLAPSFSVRIKAGEAIVRYTMQPTSGSADIDAGFVAMN
jgi:hypothetical protein